MVNRIRKFPSSKQKTVEEMDISLVNMICETTEDAVSENILNDIKYMLELQGKDEPRNLQKFY